MLLGDELRKRLEAKKESDGGFDSEGIHNAGYNRPERSVGLILCRGPITLLLDDIAVAVVCFCSVCAAFSLHSSIASVVGIVGLWLLWRVLPTRRRPHQVRIVCISDTHGRHRDLDLPEGDILIHAGDFTRFGKKEDAEDFNQWLGTLPFEHKVVVNGNHENNASWQPQVEALLSNACFLKNNGVTIKGLYIYGTDFCWPMKTQSPIFNKIPQGTDVVIAHGPAKGLVDGGSGCSTLYKVLRRIRPRLVVSGHIHYAHGMCDPQGCLRGSTFVNASNCRGRSEKIGWDPIVVNI
jgi:predicted phosphohydrolase